jgi:hypothetical protein
VWLQYKYKSASKQGTRTMEALYIWLCVLWLGPPSPLGVDQIYMEGSAQDLRTSSTVSPLT